MTMIAVAMPILSAKLEDWERMILDNMRGENKQVTDQSRENAGVHERSFLQKISDGHLCILTQEGDDPVTFWHDLVDIALPEFAEVLMDLHGTDVFTVEKMKNMLAELVYDSAEENKSVIETETRSAMLAVAIPILPRKYDAWKSTILDNMVGEKKKETDAIREAAGVRDRSFLQETPDGHMVILTFEGDDHVAGYAKIMESLPPEFAEAAMELHGLDVNAPTTSLPQLFYDSRS